jgi:6,7-dimethyl-8-ribityllumazine synthase
MALDQASQGQRALLAPGTRLAAVVSTYHLELNAAMCDSAAATLTAAGLAAGHLERVLVPGAFELPLVAQRLARRPELSAVLCFGLVLKGETEHDRYIAGAVAQALARIALEADKPVLFGLLTCNTLAQAQVRARRAEQGGLDKGREVARAAVEVLAALERCRGPQEQRR